MKILFIGNSFTYYNELPRLLEKVSGGVSVQAEMIAKGGYRLHQYADGASEDGQAVEAALRREQWDYVVLQGQSAEPVRERESFLTAAGELCDKIRACGAKPVFYQTWSYRDGTEKLAATGLSYEAFYRALKEGYQMAAEGNQAALVPVGDVFFALAEPKGPLSMMIDDDYHPSLAGSYAAAVSFYRHFFPAEAGTLWYPAEMSREDAELIWKTVTQ